MKLSKGIVQVILANILNLMISIGNGFLLPKYLSIESYAVLKTFLLYTSYIGVLHFGYVDGIYIKYGGKALGELGAEDIADSKRALSVFQFGMTLLIVIISFLMGDFILLFTAISILPINMVSFFRLLYQATGEFKEYRHIVNLSSILIFALNLYFLFIIKTDCSLWYIGIQVTVTFIVWTYYEGKNRIYGIKEKTSLKTMWVRLRETIRAGIIVMLGNFMGVWIASIDRWFVKIFYSIAEFAYYSFAVTMLRLINVVVTAFSVTLYNFFCKKPSDEEIAMLRKSVLVIGGVIIAVIFPLEFIIRTYLVKYIYAISVIKALFLAQFVLIEINAIYLNLYKALNLQRKYLRQMIIITITAFFLNGLIGYLWNDITAYAVATLLTALIWLILCQRDLAQYKMAYTEWAYLLLTIAVYLFSNYLNIWIGCFVYVGWVVTAAFLFFSKDIKKLVERQTCKNPAS